MMSSAKALGLAAVLGVTLLAGRRASAATPTPTPTGYITDPTRVRRVQEQLTAMGYPTGWDPGVVNTPTLASVNQFLQDLGQPAVGGITERVEALVARVYELERERLGTSSGSSSGGTSSGSSSSGQTQTGTVLMDPLGGRVVTDRVTIANVQRWLAGLGYDAGAADGLVGSRTLAAVNAFLQDEGETAGRTSITDAMVRLIRDAYGSGHLAGTPSQISSSGATEDATPPNDSRQRRIAAVLDATARRARRTQHRRY